MKQKEPIFNFAEPSIPMLIAVFAIIHFFGFAVLDRDWLYYSFALFPLGSPEFNLSPIREAYGLITHGFLHADMGHLIMNSAGLLIFGFITFQAIRAKNAFGAKGFTRFWVLFFAGVIVGGLFQWGYWMFQGNQYASAVGASGGVSALFAAAGWAIGGKERLAQFAMAFAMLNIIMVLLMGNIAWAAHAGGFVAGAGLAPYWVKPDSAGTSIFR